MSGLKWIGVGVAVLAVGAVISSGLGSTPEVPTGGPLAPCGPNPNCARVRVPIAADPARVEEAVQEAIANLGDSSVVATAAGWRTAVPIGPFTDDIDVAVEPDGAGSVLWVRSASRTGRSDLGVNARRVERIVRITNLILTRPD